MTKTRQPLAFSRAMRTAIKTACREYVPRCCVDIGHRFTVDDVMTVNALQWGADADPADICEVDAVHPDHLTYVEHDGHRYLLLDCYLYEYDKATKWGELITNVWVALVDDVAVAHSDDYNTTIILPRLREAGFPDHVIGPWLRG